MTDPSLNIHASKSFVWCRGDSLIAILLLLVTAALYAQTVTFEFVNYDDQDYVYENGMVKGGLTWAGVRWALTTGHAANWHPLTWLSHMLDVQLFGLWAGGHHLTNAVLHAANGVLLFVALRCLVGPVWPAAIVAAFFAWHPLRAESVAWVSERKDVLSTFFGLLALIAYARYASSSLHRTRWHVVTLAALALSLSAKAMFVTFPFLLLLLDIWPLKRIDLFAPDRVRRARELVLEKLPMFGIATAMATATYVFQSDAGAVMRSVNVTIVERTCNAVVSAVRYIWMTVAPYGLASYYPHPYTTPGMELPAWQIAGAAILLVAITAFAIWQLRRRPCIAVGWFWFLGTLVPVIGLVQVGNQALADRYTYVPVIGLSIAVVYALWPLANRRRWRSVLCVGVMAGLLVYAAIGYRQIGFWRDTLTLMRRGVDAVPGNFVAHNNLGSELDRLGRIAEAEREYRAAIVILPNDPAANANLAGLLLKSGRMDEAYRRAVLAIETDPSLAAAYVTLADWYLANGDAARGLAEYARAARMNPRERRILHKYALALAERGQIAPAMEQWKAALAIDAHYPEALDGYGRALLLTGDARGGVATLRRALEVDPTLHGAAYTIAWTLATHADPTVRDARAAREFARRALELKPGEPLYADALAAAYALGGEYGEAASLADRAAEAAERQGATGLAAAIRRRADRYRSGQPAIVNATLQSPRSE